MRYWQKHKKGILATFGTITTGIVSSVVADKIKGESLLYTLKYCIATLFDAIIYFLNLNIKVWWIIAFVLLTIIILYLVSILYRKEDTTPKGRAIDKYTSDVINGIHWKWKWVDGGGKVYVDSLEACCRYCKTPLIELDMYGRYSHECPRCSHQFNDVDKYRASVLIADNANKGLFNKD